MGELQIILALDILIKELNPETFWQETELLTIGL